MRDLCIPVTIGTRLCTERARSVPYAALAAAGAAHSWISSRRPRDTKLVNVSSTQIRRVTLLSVSLAGAVALTACGSSANTAAGTTGTAATAAVPSGSSGNSAYLPARTSAASTTGSSSSGGSAGDINACSLLTPAQISSITGFSYASATPRTIARGHDQCSYSSDTGTNLTVIVYQPNSGVSWTVLTGDSGADASVGGVGDKALTDRAVEIDVQTGNRLSAVQSGSDAGRVAVAKAVVAALH